MTETPPHSGSWDGQGSGDHDEDYKLGNPGVVLTPMQRARLKFKVNSHEIERRRNQEHTVRPEIQRALDKAKAELERRGR